MARPRATADAVVEKIVDSGKDIHGKIIGGHKPSMKFPLRSLSTVKTSAQTLRMIALSRQLIDGHARGAAGVREVRPQLRDGRVPAGEAEAPRGVPAVKQRVEPR